MGTAIRYSTAVSTWAATTTNGHRPGLPLRWRPTDLDRTVLPIESPRGNLLFATYLAYLKELNQVVPPRGNTGARCPACRHPLVAQMGRQGPYFSCGCRPGPALEPEQPYSPGRNREVVWLYPPAPEPAPVDLLREPPLLEPPPLPEPEPDVDLAAVEVEGDTENAVTAPEPRVRTSDGDDHRLVLVGGDGRPVYNFLGYDDDNRRLSYFQIEPLPTGSRPKPTDIREWAIGPGRLRWGPWKQVGMKKTKRPHRRGKKAEELSAAEADLEVVRFRWNHLAEDWADYLLADDESGNAPAGPGRREPDRLELALALKREHPEWSLRRLAKAVDRSPAWLSRAAKKAGPEVQALLKVRGGAAQGPKLAALEGALHKDPALAYLDDGELAAHAGCSVKTLSRSDYLKGLRERQALEAAGRVGTWRRVKSGDGHTDFCKAEGGTVGSAAARPVKVCPGWCPRCGGTWEKTTDCRKRLPGGRREWFGLVPHMKLGWIHTTWEWPDGGQAVPRPNPYYWEYVSRPSLVRVKFGVGWRPLDNHSFARCPRCGSDLWPAKDIGLGYWRGDG